MQAKTFRPSGTKVLHWEAHGFTSQHLVFYKRLWQNLPAEAAAPPATTYSWLRCKRGVSPKVGWCQGTLLGLVSSCQPNERPRVRSEPSCLPPQKWQNIWSGFFLLLLGLLNPHTKLGLPSNKLRVLNLYHPTCVPMATVMNSVVAAAQISPRVPGGTSLRFPDRKQYRESTNATPGMAACLHSFTPPRSIYTSSLLRMERHQPKE